MREAFLFLGVALKKENFNPEIDSSPFVVKYNPNDTFRQFHPRCHFQERYCN